ncbi:MAG: glycoside hydrolase family 27 protein [Acidobacteriaceae bacterium]|nr:glycoside hydrolase family 27 protein [Acidobacteriaceae bacterium]MBV9780388.1 glycoside hydrolase family 27 protein [Acidobacteriaceae bacterium]
MAIKRRLLFLLLLTAATLIYVFAQETGVATRDITGVWVLHIPNADGTVQDTFLKLSQNGATITGSIVRNYHETKISEGSYRNGKLHLTVNPWRTIVLTYEGTLSDNHLKITFSETGGRENPPSVTVSGERSSEAALSPPAPLPLPALHDVPDNGLARTPPMGWNSWNYFEGKVDDATVRSIADVMVSSGMAKAGYAHVNIDDTWEDGRDEAGNIRANRKFPDIAALAAYVHSKGLKIGIYSSPGPKTCGGYEGSYGHELQDAKTYASWGIDYLKYDWCSAGAIYKDRDMRAAYQKMGEALQSTGRPIVFSLCQYGREKVWTWGAKVGGNLWRTTDDIGDDWPSMSGIGFRQAEISSYMQPGHWNDPDMLEIGNGGMTDDEYRVHMSLWCLLAAPLLAGNDLRKMSDATLAILTNRDVIAVDQDPAARPPKRMVRNNETEVWSRPMQDGSTVVALFNRGEKAKDVTVTWQELGLIGHIQGRDLWKHERVGLSGPTYTTLVPKHGVVMLRIQKG